MNWAGLFDTHPFVRPFDQKVYKGTFEVVKPYEDVGPFGEVPTFGWRIQDYVNALIKSGFVISRMEKFIVLLTIFQTAAIYLKKLDIVLCSMMLMDCEDFDGTVREIKRVLKKNGIIFISVLHPCFNGKEIRWSNDDEGNTEVKVKDYYSPNTWEGKIAQSIQTPVIWRHRTLQDYFKMFIKYDLQLIDFNEPIPTEEQILKSDRIEWLRNIPMFLFIELKK